GWQFIGKKLSEMRTSDKRMIIAVIRRKVGNKDEIIFPHGNDTILADDEVTVIGDAHLDQEMQHFLGVETTLPKSAVIAGGTVVGLHIARELKNKGLSVR